MGEEWINNTFLRPNEISCRVQTINENGLSLLLYITSRAGQNALDKKFGIWQDSYQIIGTDLFCTISIYNKDIQQWISRSDVGTANYTEKEKSRSSDAFKRACVKFGIARELYSAPFIWISANDCNIKKKGDKFTTYDKFKVTYIDYTKNGEINELEIVNEGNNEVVFRKFSDEQIGIAKQEALRKKMKEANVEKEQVLKHFRLENLESINTTAFVKIMNKLDKTIQFNKEKSNEGNR